MGADKINSFSKPMLSADLEGSLLTRDRDRDREGKKLESRDFNQRASRCRQRGLPSG